MKNSFTLLEIILTLVISSIIVIYSALFTKELFFENKINQQLELQKINLLSTKIFFEKHLKEIDDFSFSNENLYFKNSLLLSNIKEFKLNKSSNNVTIFINLDGKIIQNWEFSL
jgi:type II secretory pathway component PulJ